MSTLFNKLTLCAKGFNSFTAAVTWTTSNKVQRVAPAALDVIKEDEASTLLAWVYQHTPPGDASEDQVPGSPPAEPSTAGSPQEQVGEDQPASEQVDEAEVENEPWLMSPQPGFSLPFPPPTLAGFSSTPPLRLAPNPPRDDPSWGASYVEVYEAPIDIGHSICFSNGIEDPVMPADQLFPLQQVAAIHDGQGVVDAESASIQHQNPPPPAGTNPPADVWSSTDLPAPIFLSSLPLDTDANAEDTDELDPVVNDVVHFVLQEDSPQDGEVHPPAGEEMDVNIEAVVNFVLDDE